MNKTLKSLLAVVGITVLAGCNNSYDQAKSQAPTKPAETPVQQSFKTEEGLIACGVAYGTLSVYAVPEKREYLKNRGAQLIGAAEKLNPAAPQVAINMLRANVAAIDRDEPGKADSVIATEKGCQKWLPTVGY